jgi:hypothetical protein
MVEGRTYTDISRSEYADMAPISKLTKEITRGLEQK